MSGVLRARFRNSVGGFLLDVEFEVPSRGVTALFGRSGVGKTMVLRNLAGLERSNVGLLQVGDAVWQDETRGLFVSAHKRSVGYVFQEASLFPHLNVRGNLMFAWKRVPVSDRGVINFDDVVNLLGLEKFLERAPSRLSGGEKQRVAIGRALLMSPRLLLMDEPLSALDTRSKSEIIPYFERLRTELRIPILLVSHSLNEVLRLADNMVLMENGRIQAIGAAAELAKERLFFESEKEAMRQCSCGCPCCGGGVGS